jgi:hypothetical protein
VEFAKDHLEIIQNVSLKCYGVEEIKSIVAPKIRKFTVLMEREITLKN